MLSAPLCAFSAVSGSLVGLYHLPGDVNHCDLIRIDLITGENTTLFSDVSTCTSLTTNFPSFSAAGAAGSLLVAISSASAVVEIEIASGKSTALGALANNDSDIMTGLAHWPEGFTVVGTQFGIWNVTSAGQNDLIIPLEGADAFGEAFVFAGPWPTLYVVDENSKSVLIIDVETKAIVHSSGLANPIGSVLGPTGTLLQEKGYVLYSTPAAGGTAKRVLNIPDGPGYPRTNGLAGQQYWW
jgi:hypothetical protein